MYKLSRLAAEDFAVIYTYSLQNFGAAQADAYTEELERTFKLLFINLHKPSGSDP